MTPKITQSKPLKVHVLVDLEWSESAGGHVKCWERFGKAAAGLKDLDLTLHFAGEEESHRELAANVHMYLHRPVFSSKLIPFLGHMPDHSDLAPYHPEVARHLLQADVIHTTDAFFAYAKTAERIAHEIGVPLVHSIHTDTVSYTKIFTRSLIERSMKGFSRLLDETFKIPALAADNMAGKLKRHETAARFVLASRGEDRAEAVRNVGAERVRDLRLGVDFDMFNPIRGDRKAIETAYSIPSKSFIIAFAGRLDEGKNIYVLMDAIERCLRAGMPLFFIAAGSGPAGREIERRFGHAAFCPGNLRPEELARLYASADILALPSKVETWSMIAAEAMASGLPVVAANLSGVGRFINHSGAGLVVAEDTAAAWAAALEEAREKLTTTDARNAALGAAKNNFVSWSQALEEDLLPIWQEAAGRKPQKAAEQAA